MRLVNIEPEEFGIKRDGPQQIRIIGTSVGSKGPGQNMFIMPVRKGDLEVQPELWEINPTTSGKPQIVANTAKARGGTIIKVSTLNRSGKRIGRIYIRERDLGSVQCVGFGIAGDEEGIVTWEEAVLRVHGPVVVLYLVNVGPPNEFLVISEGEEVTRYPATEEAAEFQADDYIRIDDPRVRRWKEEEFVPYA